jgi:hypothetical protein
VRVEDRRRLKFRILEGFHLVLELRNMLLHFFDLSLEGRDFIIARCPKSRGEAQGRKKRNDSETCRKTCDTTAFRIHAISRYATKVKFVAMDLLNFFSLTATICNRLSDRPVHPGNLSPAKLSLVRPPIRSPALKRHRVIVELLVVRRGIVINLIEQLS